MNILILEDEKLASEKLERSLLEVEPQAHIVARLQTVASAVEWLRSHPHPDLIVTDIRLLDGLCFEIFEQVKVEKPVIFTTAYDQYAIKAFEVNSIDYLLKPVQQEKLKASLGKLKNLAPKPAAIDYQEMLRLLKAAPAEYKSRFMVRLGQKIIALSADKIAYFFSENKLTYIVAKDGKRYPMDQPLEELMDVLDPRVFFRINRQFIITFDSIAEIHPYFKGRIKLLLNPKTEEEVVISSERTPEFKKWIDQ
ncbi:LytTR family DNA-binding domain-containing protein [Fulvivirgaceae bacterium PWU4]|uniref:LytTR family DNA-binding domain-containing protein n=1 Tax=Chryseosolibacter histidini TaxID=2782349 RepID=A0AAP2DS22_9BACT|nr:LytTR family DNA-binding domain-containing protein [Chryseosolibacter histidini]MBT1701435.1 LytTR family DNA-binding domain-containing protein [Chryseosolibacter histidini]